MNWNRWSRAVLLAFLIPLSLLGQETKDTKSKKADVIQRSREWMTRLEEHQLLQLPDRNTDKFRESLKKFAAFADGERPQVDEYLEAAGYPVADQSDTWRELSPSIKIALAAKQAYAISERNGELFGALLAKRLSQEHPAAKADTDLKAFFAVKVDGKIKPEFKSYESVTSGDFTLSDKLAKPLLTLASYVSSKSAVTDIDLARMTPLSYSRQLEILASSRSSIDVLNTLVKESFATFAELYDQKHSELLTKQMVSRWSKSIVDSYPAAKKEAILVAWVDFKFDSPDVPSRDSSAGPSESGPRDPKTPGPKGTGPAGPGERDLGISLEFPGLGDVNSKRQYNPPRKPTSESSSGKTTPKTPNSAKEGKPGVGSI